MMENNIWLRIYIYFPSLPCPAVVGDIEVAHSHFRGPYPEMGAATFLIFQIDISQLGQV